MCSNEEKYLVDISSAKGLKCSIEKIFLIRDNLNSALKDIVKNIDEVISNLISSKITKEEFDEIMKEKYEKFGIYLSMKKNKEIFYIDKDFLKELKDNNKEDK